ncbi:MAG: transketolase [Candidatus Competibacteraceae bacterium]|nr:transketolase [Candidatus Competibacteraceae bacterium]
MNSVTSRSLDLPALRRKADWVWRETLRIHRRSPETRVASALSCIEILVALYYGGLLRYDPTLPRCPDRDRFIASKGHGAISLYPILADLGFFPTEALTQIGQPDALLSAIPEPAIPGFETINGSLGHGVGVGCGMALALRRNDPDRRVVVLVGDGELHEGANWEAFMLAAHYRLDNLTVIVDNNHISMLGPTDTIISHRSLTAKLEAFGWAVTQVDGHDLGALLTVLAAATPGQPRCIVADTHKGRGVPGLEDAPLSHVTSIPPAQIDALLGKAP